jgi:hypothetical protein
MVRESQVVLPARADYFLRGIGTYIGPSNTHRFDLRGPRFETIPWLGHWATCMEKRVRSLLSRTGLYYPLV